MAVLVDPGYFCSLGEAPISVSLLNKTTSMESNSNIATGDASSHGHSIRPHVRLLKEICEGNIDTAYRSETVAVFSRT